MLRCFLIEIKFVLLISFRRYTQKHKSTLIITSSLHLSETKQNKNKQHIPILIRAIYNQGELVTHSSDPPENSIVRSSLDEAAITLLPLKNDGIDCPSGRSSFTSSSPSFGRSAGSRCTSQRWGVRVREVVAASCDRRDHRRRCRGCSA